MSVYNCISILAWSIGYFPFQSPFLHSRRAPCCSFANIYTVAVILLGTFMDFDLIIHKPLLFIKSAPIVMKIIFVSCCITELILPLACRITGAVYGQKFCSAKRDLEKLSHLGFKRQRDWFKVCVYAIMAVQSALHVSFWVRTVMDHMDAIFTVDDMMAPDHILSWIWEPLVTFNNARALINPTYCELVASWFVICVGLEMKMAHKAVYDLLLASVEQISTNRDSAAIELFEHLQRLKASFKVCGQLIGVYTLVIIMLGIVSLTYVIYIVIWPLDAVVGFVEIYGLLVQVLIVVFLGQVLESQVRKKREELKELLVSYNSALLSSSLKLFLVATHATDWDWSLTAGSFFNVNLYCIPGMIGALTTYTMFMVQLQLSEDESKSYNCSAIQT